MIDVKDILTSWAKSANPTEIEFRRAQDRFDVCNGCEFKKQLIKNKEWTIYCGACGCPIEGKVYSSVINPCPKNKWKDVDEKYLITPGFKNKNTFL